MPYLFDLDTYSHFKLKEALGKGIKQRCSNCHAANSICEALIFQYSILSARIDDRGADIQMTWVYLPKGQKACD